MKTVTIKSSCNDNAEPTRTVTFLRDGSPVATVEVSYDEGFEWAAEYACDWCSYGKLPKVSTPVDIAPPALPEPPAEIYLPPTAAEFLKLVRDGKVQVETPSGDTTNALIDRASVGWARIGWDYELGDDNEWVAYHDSTVIDELTVFQRVDHKVSANGVTFIIEEL